MDRTTFQSRVHNWVLTCFGEKVAMDRSERNRRFLEEALELVQANGGSKEMAHELVEYVFSRDTGELDQEVGGAMVTLASLCATAGVDLETAAEREISRIDTPEIIAKIREKHKTKPTFERNY